MLVAMLGVILELPSQEIKYLEVCMTNIGIAFQIADDLLNIVP
jgi:geranylgeranyl pyrophosphate synthase